MQHMARSPQWFQNDPQAVAEYIVKYGAMTPVWALRGGDDEVSVVEAKFEHHDRDLGLVV